MNPRRSANKALAFLLAERYSSYGHGCCLSSTWPEIRASEPTSLEAFRAVVTERTYNVVRVRSTPWKLRLCRAHKIRLGRFASHRARHRLSADVLRTPSVGFVRHGFRWFET